MRFDIPLVAAAAGLLGSAHSAWLPARPGSVDPEAWKSWEDDFGGRPFDHGRPGWAWGPGRPQIPPHYGPSPATSSEAASSTSATSSSSSTTSSETTSQPTTSSAVSTATTSSVYTTTTTTVSSSTSSTSSTSSATESTLTASSSPSISSNSSSLAPTSSVNTTTTTSTALTTITTTAANETSSGPDSATTSSSENSSNGGTTSTIEVTPSTTSSLFNTTTVAGSTGLSTLTSSSTSSVVVSPTGSSSSTPLNSSSIYAPTGTGSSTTSYTIVSSYPIYRSDSCFTSTNASSSLPYVTGTGSSVASSGTSISANSSSSSFLTGSSGFVSTSTASQTVSLNSTSSILATGSSTTASAQPTVSANSTTSSFLTGTSSPVISASPTLSLNATTTAATNTTSTTMSPIARSTDCASLCSSMTFNGFDGQMYSCTSVTSGSSVSVASGQQGICGSSVTAPKDLCRVTLGVQTSDASNTYIEVWMPSDGSWNGRVMATDNGGLNGCVNYAQLAYIAGKDFAVIGDNGGHNTSAFNGQWMDNNNEVILDWSYRARHAAIGTGKQLVNSFYGKGANKAYYIGCSTGGQQGLKNAQTYPGDFDGIIAGSAAADFNHLQDWSGRFLLLTGEQGSDSYLSQDQWLTVQEEVLKQCDQPIDGVNDGIIEDPSLCIGRFDSSQLLSQGLTQAQVNTVNQIHTELYDQQGNLLFPAFTYGAEYDGFRTGLLSGTVQGITHDWFLYGVYNGSGFDATQLSQTDYTRADDLDSLHGGVSAFSGDLSGFQGSGAKLLQYHGMTDPMITGFNAQRYYTKVSQTMGLGNGDLDNFYRLFRISGMSHCSVGGISGAGAWMFGQNSQSSAAASNVIDIMVDWVENNNAPDTLPGTKFWYDQPANGIQLTRDHCRFPYRTTYRGSGDGNDASNWGCDLIANWGSCGAGGIAPRTC